MRRKNKPNKCEYSCHIKAEQEGQKSGLRGEYYRLVITLYLKHELHRHDKQNKTQYAV